MKITVNANSLRAAMASVSGKQDGRDYLQWICLDLDCNPPMIVATDGHAMVEASVSVEFGLPESRELRTGRVLFQVSRKLPKNCDIAVLDTTERQVSDAHRGDFKTPVFIGLAEPDTTAAFPEWQRVSAFRRKDWDYQVTARSVALNTNMIARAVGDAPVRLELPKDKTHPIRVRPLETGQDWLMTVMPCFDKDPES